jgi:hypothetical protein
MIDVLFPKRSPAPRERDTRPVAGDYRPKQLRAVGTESDGFYGNEPSSLLDGPGVNLNRLEDELNRNRLDEIALLVRALTYGEMMDLANAIWKIRPDGAVDQQSLPMMLHLWSTSSQGEPAENKPADGKTEQ